MQRGRWTTDSRVVWTLFNAPFLSRRARLRGFWHYVVRRYPYEICMVCGRRVGRFYGYVSWWRATDEVWLDVTGDEHSVWCPACFTREAERKGIHVRWEAIEEGNDAG